ncbi:MAG: sugar ABC transporter substrate-binding protein [Methylobacteriaceae bacterium]|nr:sugar ABC transporter substrate-binding protein [Methylobacteriaceae bacterium]
MQTLLARRDFLKSSAALCAAPLLLTSDASLAAASKHITIIKGPHSANEVKYEDEIIADFKKKQPDVDVTFTTYDWANMNPQLTAAFASGSPPDVLYLVDLIYPGFAKRGLLHDMTQLVAEPGWQSERAAIEPFAWNLAKSTQGLWGVPVLGAVYNIFVNLDLLDAAGVTGTWQRSYDDMLAAGKKLTKGDTYGISFRTRVADFAFWDWFPYIHNAGADILNADWSGNGLAGAEPAMQFIIDVHTAGVTPKIGSVDWQGQFDLFKAGKIAIYHGEAPQISDLLAKPPGFKWDVASAPPGPKAQTVMGNFGIMCIAEASTQKEAAWEFIKHWASGPEVGRFASEVNLQVVRSDIVGELYRDAPPMKKVQSEFVPRVRGVQPHPKILQMLQSIWPVAEQAYIGGMTGAQAIAEMSKIIDGLI